jgi:hypothetical protein
MANKANRSTLIKRLTRKTEQITDKRAALPSTDVPQSHETATFRKPGTETHTFLKSPNSCDWQQPGNSTEIQKNCPEIEVLERCQFIGKLYPWKSKGTQREIIGLLVPVETALREVRYATSQPDLTRADFVNLLERNKVSVFSNIDQFVKAKEASRNEEIISQLKKNAHASHSPFEKGEADQLASI